MCLEITLLGANGLKSVRPCGNFTGNAQNNYHSYDFENYYICVFKIPTTFTEATELMWRLNNKSKDISVFPHERPSGYIDWLMQETCNSIVNALELRLSCINPSIYSPPTHHHHHHHKTMQTHPYIDSFINRTICIYIEEFWSSIWHTTPLSGQVLEHITLYCLNKMAVIL